MLVTSLTAERWQDLRCALARNPALPAALIDQLTALGDEAVHDALAARSDLSQEQISHLVRGGGAGTLIRLLERGALRPSDIHRYDPSVVVAMADLGVVPLPWARQAAAEPDPEIRGDLAATRYLPEEIAEMLAADPDPWVATRAAESPGITGALAARLAAHPHMEVREALARNDRVPAELLAALADRRTPQAERCAGCDGSRPEQHCDGTHQGAWHGLDQALALNAATPGVTAGRFASHPWMLVRWELAKRTDLPAAAYRTLARDPIPGVRGELASNPAIGEELIRMLAQDEGHNVRRSLAHNPMVPLDVLSGLASLAKIGPTVLPRIASATEAEVRELAASPVATIRMLVAQREELPHDVVDRLAADSDAKVLKSIAANPALGEAQLRRMARAHGLRVAARVAANPSCPPGLLAELAGLAKGSYRVLRNIAEHPSAPAEALLVCLAEERARRPAARHPALPVRSLAGLLADDDDQVAVSAAENPSLPEPLMREIARPGTDSGRA